MYSTGADPVAWRHGRDWRQSFPWTLLAALADAAVASYDADNDRAVDVVNVVVAAANVAVVDATAVDADAGSVFGDSISQPERRKPTIPNRARE
jgi:hypothetical protein